MNGYSQHDIEKFEAALNAANYAFRTYDYEQKESIEIPSTDNDAALTIDNDFTVDSVSTMNIGCDFPDEKFLENPKSNYSHDHLRHVRGKMCDSNILHIEITCRGHIICKGCCRIITENEIDQHAHNVKETYNSYGTDIRTFTCDFGEYGCCAICFMAEEYLTYWDIERHINSAAHAKHYRSMPREYEIFPSSNL